MKSKSFPYIGTNATYTFPAQNDRKAIVKVDFSGLTSILLNNMSALFTQ